MQAVHAGVLKKDGGRIKPQTIGNYEMVLALVKEFEEFNGAELRIKQLPRHNKKIFLQEEHYWKQFYHRFTDFFFTIKTAMTIMQGM